MLLRVPGGSSWWDVVSSSDDPRRFRPTDDVVDDPTPEELDSAIDAMAAGDQEYVGVEEGDTFVQAAGLDDEYVLERWSDGSMRAQRPSATLAEVREAMHRFLAGDLTGGLADTAAAEPEKKKRRWFGNG